MNDEVLKGRQSILYDAANIGGAVSLQLAFSLRPFRDQGRALEK